MGNLKTNLIILAVLTTLLWELRTNLFLRGRAQTGPGRLYHQEQGLRLQRQDRASRGCLGEPDFYRVAAGVAEAH